MAPFNATPADVLRRSAFFGGPSHDCVAAPALAERREPAGAGRVSDVTAGANRRDALLAQYPGLQAGTGIAIAHPAHGDVRLGPRSAVTSPAGY